jgi:peroxiredoxin
MAARLHLPFAVLSDERFELTNALRLPTFEVDGMRLIERLTLIMRRTTIEGILYPVVNPEQSATEIIRWLDEHPM